MRNAVILHYVAGLALALLLAACASQPGADISLPAESVMPIPEAPPELTERTAGEYTESLRGARRYLEERELIPAAFVLAEIDSAQLHAVELADFRELNIRLNYMQGKLNRATQLTGEALTDSSKLDTETLWNLQQWQLRLLKDSGSNLQRARYAASILPQYPASARQRQLIAEVWRDLQSTALEQLQLARKQSRDRTWRAWLDLALLHNGLPMEPSIQHADWQRWRAAHPRHPAAIDPPGGHNLLPTQIPFTVALVLPMSGPLAQASQAIVDGYLLAMMKARQLGWPAQSLLFFDVTSFADVNEAYLAAEAAGAEAIVGPLTRESLGRWRADSSTPIPKLALNWMQQQQQTDGHMYQMALAPEDEARQLAQLAYGDGARRALIIQPASAFGDDMANNFEQAWLEQQGSISAKAIYSDPGDYSSSIQGALKLADSEQRARQIRRLMDNRMEFSPRRREDIDSVFLFTGNPQEARSLKPLLAFHYAGDLPVYSTSHVFSGNPDPQQDRDLNGIQLLEMPWSLEPDNSLRAELEQLEYSGKLSVMYALGADAFLLHWRLPQLRYSSNYSVRGYTGLLSMDAEGRIHRQLRPASIVSGIPIPRAQ